MRPVRGVDERRRWDALMARHHYLPYRGLFGRSLRHVAVRGGTWLALLGWQAGAFKVGVRDAWIGWSREPGGTARWRAHGRQGRARRLEAGRGRTAHDGRRGGARHGAGAGAGAGGGQDQRDPGGARTDARPRPRRPDGDARRAARAAGDGARPGRGLRRRLRGRRREGQPADDARRPARHRLEPGAPRRRRAGEGARPRRAARLRRGRRRRPGVGRVLRSARAAAGFRIDRERHLVKQDAGSRETAYGLTSLGPARPAPSGSGSSSGATGTSGTGSTTCATSPTTRTAAGRTSATCRATWPA